MNNKIKEVISKEINPILEIHNGSCELVKIEDNNVYLKLKGGCAGCPSSKLTLFNGISPILLEHFPEIKSINLYE